MANRYVESCSTSLIIGEVQTKTTMRYHFTSIRLAIIKQVLVRMWNNKNTIHSSVQSLSCVRLFVTPWITARQASLSITNSQSSLKLTSIELVMPSSHLILCRPLLFLPPIPASIRVFSNESTLLMRWPKYWSFSLVEMKLMQPLWKIVQISLQIKVELMHDPAIPLLGIYLKEMKLLSLWNICT